MGYRELGRMEIIEVVRHWQAGTTVGCSMLRCRSQAAASERTVARSVLGDRGGTARRTARARPLWLPRRRGSRPGCTSALKPHPATVARRAPPTVLAR